MPFSKVTPGVIVILLLLIFSGLYSIHHHFQMDGTKQTRMRNDWNLLVKMEEDVKIHFFPFL